MEGAAEHEAEGVWGPAAAGQVCVNRAVCACQLETPCNETAWPQASAGCSALPQHHTASLGALASRLMVGRVAPSEMLKNSSNTAARLERPRSGSQRGLGTFTAGRGRNSCKVMVQGGALSRWRRTTQP